MQEELLHFVWKYRKFPLNTIRSTANRPIAVISLGQHNLLSGPDFFNAKVKIGDQVWAGNVEIHVKSSDWEAHGHSTDPKYDSVILHVVWEHDRDIKRKDGTVIPVLELSNYIPKTLLTSYEALMQGKSSSFINCGRGITEIGGFTWNNWLERLTLERLEDKSEMVLELLAEFGNDWERVLFVMLFKNFGSKINGAFFLELAKRTDFTVVRKLNGKPMELEALFMGMAGLLERKDVEDGYYKLLWKEYRYLKQKYGLRDIALGAPEFYKLRPSNFPTIRLAQLAQLYAGSHRIFQVLAKGDMQEIRNLFKVTLPEYWQKHYNFGKESPQKEKNMTRAFVDLLLINTVWPLRFAHAHKKGMPCSEDLLHFISALPPERNGIIEKFRELPILVTTATESQALLQLYNAYCTQDKCLQCAVGASLLQAAY